jgi:hypothetical protein
MTRLDFLINEYKLIQKKESNLSRAKRDFIEATVKNLLAAGFLNEDLSVRSTKEETYKI